MPRTPTQARPSTGRSAGSGEVAVIRKVAAILGNRPEEATQLRQHLGFAPRRAQIALDIFAMTEPLTPDGETLWDEAMARIERERQDTALICARAVAL